MSIVDLVFKASFVVQMVMLVLVGLSVFSWVTIFHRVGILRTAKNTMVKFEDHFWSGQDLSQLFRQVNHANYNSTGIENIFSAGFKEFSRLRQQNTVDPDAVMEGTQRAMRSVTSREADKLEAGLSFLATVGSTSPYIGLFGTVWGIMHAFHGLANVQQATIASVAPGISEALLATAIGLFAAIPAVIAYNRFAARVTTIVGSYETFADEFASILHRKAHSEPMRG